MASIDQDAYDNLKNRDWTYSEVAEELGIDPEKFDYLMSNRFDNPENGKEGKTFHLTYTLEWAQRVKEGHHYGAADKETKSVLEEAGYSEPA